MIRHIVEIDKEHALALEKRVWQGNFGESLVCAMASAAGLVATKRSLDVDGVDFHLLYSGRLNGRRHPAVDVQVKSWSAPKLTDGHFSYPIPRENYDNLVGTIGEDFPIARLLLLVIVPPTEDEYMTIEDTCVLLRHQVYWHNLMSMPRLADNENLTSKTVYVPQSNHVDASVLRSLLARDFSEDAL